MTKWLSGINETRKIFLNQEISSGNIIFFIALALCAGPWINAPLALIGGLVVSLFTGRSSSHLNNRITQILLQCSVVGLGFGMNLNTALQAGREGFLYTLVSIGVTLILGLLAGRAFHIEKKISYLISSGTAICGGSAIAAMAPVIKADDKQISAALGTVFILNSAALLIFPVIGNKIHLSQEQFGMWCAIAIHDTSSVVAAAGKYGDKALELATTVKLARALWIIPVALISSFIFKTGSHTIRVPYFIGFFVLAMIAGTYLPFVRQLIPFVAQLSRAGLKITLFLIGAGLSAGTMKQIGLRPLLHGLLLWIVISASALWVIVYIL